MRIEAGIRACPRAQIFLFDVNQQQETLLHNQTSSMGSRHSRSRAWPPTAQPHKQSINGAVVFPSAPHPTHSFSRSPPTPQRAFTSPEKHFTSAYPLPHHDGCRLSSQVPQTESSRSTSVVKLKAAVDDGVMTGGCCMAASDLQDPAAARTPPAKGQASAQLQLGHLVDQQKELSAPRRTRCLSSIF